VEPQVSSISPSTVDIGNGTRGTILDQTIASTTIEAHDGQTVVIGGLISKRDEKQQRGIPWLGDLPYVGALFRYRSHIKNKKELMIILTPHIIRNPMDAQRVFLEEGRKMSWSLDDVQAMHGTLPGESFLRRSCPEDALPGAMMNPLNERFLAPNTTVPGPVDEKLGTPQGGTIRPQPQQQMPMPNQQQPQTPNNPGFLQPYNPQAPMFQNAPPAPGALPPGGQGTFQQQQYTPVNNNVTGQAPQGAVTNNMVNGQPPGGTMTYGQAMQYQQQLQMQMQQQMNNQQQQPQINGNYKTTVSYGPVLGSTAASQQFNQQTMSGVPGGQQP
jgi:hypothetical protein